MLNMFLFTMSLMIGTAGLPHVIIRFFTVPKVRMPASAGWALVFIALLYTVAPAVGSMARLNLTTTFWPGAVEGRVSDAPALSLADIQTREDLSWIRNWEKTGLLKYEDKNGDGLIQYINPAKLAGPNKAIADATQGSDRRPRRPEPAGSGGSDLGRSGAGQWRGKRRTGCAAGGHCRGHRGT
jgi:cation/acetate symporter